MGVGHLPRVVVVCLLAGRYAAAGAEEVEGGSAGVSAAATPAATAAANANATPTATRRTTTAANASARAGSLTGSVEPQGNRRPPPAVVYVPILGVVGLPLVLPTAIPQPREEGTVRKERKP